MLSNTNWGGDRSVLLNLYRFLVRSKLNYVSIVYGSARKSYLKCLDTIHHQGLRLALGAFRTSPVESLYAESNKPSFYTRENYRSNTPRSERQIRRILLIIVFLIQNTKDFIIIHLRLLSLSV